MKEMNKLNVVQNESIPISIKREVKVASSNYNPTYRLESAISE